jgi:multiple antibiotic resistance protein
VSIALDMAAGAGAAFGALFAVVNPLSTLPVFSALSLGYTDDDRRALARRTAAFSFWILFIGLIVGRFVLHFFGISLGALEVAGGLLVALAGWRLIQNTSSTLTVDDDRDPAFTPLAMPISAGPGALGVVLGVSTRANDYHDYPAYALGILGVSISLYLFLRHGHGLLTRLGPGGMRAVNQIVGFLVIAIGAELIMHGAVVTGAVYHSYTH